jgi:NAD(P)-dependent dehydrogenase (short-subunit alcohol dehydrogenase family)
MNVEGVPMKAILAKAINKFGRIDVVVNNAGYTSLIVKL